MVIRLAQMKQLEASVREGFENEMVQYCHSVSPAVCDVAGNENVLQFVRTGIERAKACGFTDVDFISLYLELMLRFGSGFESDPQFSRVGEIIQAKPKDPEMIMAGQLHRQLQLYLEQVHGTDGSLAQAALGRLAAPGQSWSIRTNDGKPGIMRMLGAVYPEKYAYVGGPALDPIISKAVEQARRAGVPSHNGVSLLAIMAFFFGHDALSDPLYAWVPATLGDPRFQSPEDRAANLLNRLRLYAGRIAASSGAVR
jgi:hypothetical protein